jgi:hypothetical protein
VASTNTNEKNSHLCSWQALHYNLEMQPAPSPSPGRPVLDPAAVALRLASALLGGYGFVWGFVTLGITAGMALGMAYDQAWTLVMMLAFVLFLVVFLWAFAARSLLHVWFVLGGGGLGMTLVALLLGARLAMS